MSTSPSSTSAEKRERFLIIIGIVFLVVMIVPLFYYLFGSEVSKLRLQRDTLREDVRKLNLEVDKQAETKRQMDILNTQSLPNGEFTQSLYQNWLFDMAGDVGIRDRRIDPGSSAPMKDIYTKYTYTLHGKGTLEQLSEFFRRFHKTKYLHLIRKVAPRPTKGSKDLELSITVEALALRGAKTNKTLPIVPRGDLAVSDAEKKMLKEISERAIFSPYAPAPPRVEASAPPPPPKQEEFEHHPYCYVVAVVKGVDDKPQVWIDLRTEGKKFKLHIGEMFRLGDVRCYVRKIEFDPERVTFEVAKSLYTIRPGKSFAEYE